MFKLMTDNFKHLSTPGSLDAIQLRLPKTVSDAIDLAKAIGERYLRVDSLCLVQDDEDDVSLGIAMMNLIYHGSCFTIVAGSGVDASAGLPSIGENGRQHQHQIMKEVALSIKMMVLHIIDWHLSRSVYNARGWTLQELIMPRRTVIFINGQVYFRCQEANWSEETYSDIRTHWLDPDDSNISRIPDFYDGFLPTLWAYQKICEEYSRRKLRNDGDALRALAGVCRSLEAGMETKMLEGLPGNYLDHFLLFISSTGNMRRRCEFASFSWAGWEGPIMWPRENSMWYDGTTERTWNTSNILKYFQYGCFIDWKFLKSDADLDILSSWPLRKSSLVLQIIKEHPDVFPDIDKNPTEALSVPDFYGWSGYDEVCYWYPSLSFGDEDNGDRIDQLQRPRNGFNHRSLNLVNGQAEFDRILSRVEEDYERRGLSNWMAQRRLRIRRYQQPKSDCGPRPIFHENKENYQFRQPHVALAERSYHDPETRDRRRQRAISWIENQVAEGVVALSDALKIPNFPLYPILHFVTISFHLTLGTGAVRDCHSQSPFERMPGIPLLSATSQLIGSLHPDSLDLLESPGSVIECLLISRCNTPTVASALLTAKDIDMEKPWNLFWILYVVWKDGIAERRGVGQVLNEALERAVEPKPEVKLVLLG